MPHFYKKLFMVVALATSQIFPQLAAAEYLVVNFRDGTTTSFDLNDRPNVSLVETRMIITTASVEAEYESASVETFVIKEGSGIAVSPVPGETRLIYRDKDIASVSGLGPETRVCLYGVGGDLIAACVADDGTGTVSFDLSSCPKGIYIISIDNGQSFKIIR